MKTLSKIFCLVFAFHGLGALIGAYWNPSLLLFAMISLVLSYMSFQDIKKEKKNENK